MRKTLCTEDCINLFYLNIDGTYVFSTATNEYVSLPDAKDYCQAMGGFLPTLYNAALRDSLVETMNTLDFGNYDMHH